MERKLALAVALCKGQKIPENAITVEIEVQDANFYDSEDRYIRSVDIDNTWLCRDTYAIEFTGKREFTVEEFNQWLAENSDAVANYLYQEKAAMEEMAQIVPAIQEQLARGMQLAKEYGIPFIIDVDGGEVDLRMVSVVDWDSSSLHC